jgi:hypothetical protein
MKVKLHTLTEEHRDLIYKITKTVRHDLQANLARILKHGTYTDLDKTRILEPLRKKYIEYLRALEKTEL